MSFLPETADHKLPDTLAEGEAMGLGDTLWSSCRRKKQQAARAEITTASNDRENDS